MLEGGRRKPLPIMPCAIGKVPRHDPDSQGALDTQRSSWDVCVFRTLMECICDACRRSLDTGSSTTPRSKTGQQARRSGLLNSREKDQVDSLHM